MYVAVPPAGVDLLGLLGGFRLEATIGAELAAGRRRRLDEDELAAPLGMGLQQIVDGAHPVQDAFGVVEALDADGDPRIGASPKRLADRPPAFLDRRLPASAAGGHSIEIG